MENKNKRLGGKGGGKVVESARRRETGERHERLVGKKKKGSNKMKLGRPVLFPFRNDLPLKGSK